MMNDNQRVQTICLLLLTAIGLGVALKFLAPVLVPFTVAVVVVYCLVPIIDAHRTFLATLACAIGFICIVITFIL